ncbi:unnamed protein product [Schistosoma margrebowiei]|uniref:Uncharacterized protein n=1 Tax=Schistosoma margrebowiei TaxID=48269 RepID=A0A183M822_9TREM|nr:unnamed protein product [Schistosoma margrebowiei]
MWLTGRTSQLAVEMRVYNLAVLRISETHWTEAGQKRLDMGDMLLYSGREEETLHTLRGLFLCYPKKHEIHLLNGNFTDPESPKHHSKQRRR